MTAPHIAGFTFVEHIGSGGFADVFLYEQEWPRQRVAIKVVRPDVPLTEREKALFTSEANAMARLADHPYIVSVMTAGVTEEDGGAGRPYFVMRYCPPPDLGARVKAAPMPVAEAVACGIKLASAIETAHRSGMLHRDIKPSNVLVTAYNEPALTDFGIAGPMHDVHLDAEVRISYPWSPPELLDGSSNGSVASDVYSLGATIWNLLVGRSPFSVPNGDNSARALTARILHAAPPPTHRPDVPPALDRLLQQCLAKEPSHRPHSAMELARALQGIESHSGFARTPIAVEGDPAVSPTVPATAPATDPDATHVKPVAVPATPPPGPDRAAGSNPRPTVLAAYAVALVAALVAGVVLMFTASDRDDDPRPDPTDDPSHTPASVLPEEPLAAPRVSGERAGDRVRFTWEAADRPFADDTWEWRRTDTGGSARTAETTLLVRTGQRVCLQVRLVRGAEPSPWTEECVA